VPFGLDLRGAVVFFDVLRAGEDFPDVGFLRRVLVVLLGGVDLRAIDNYAHTQIAF